MWPVLLCNRRSWAKNSRLFWRWSWLWIRFTISTRWAKGTGEHWSWQKDLWGRHLSFIYGDVLLIKYKELAVFHENSGGVVTLAVTSTDDHRAMALSVFGHEFVEFIETTNDHFTSRLVVSGLHIARPDILSFMPRKQFSLNVIFTRLTQRKRREVMFSGQWFDIGTVNIYNRAKSWRGD